MPSAKIAAATNGDNTLVAAPDTSRKIRVLGYVLVSSGTVNAKLQSDAGGSAVDLTGPLNLKAQTVVQAPIAPALVSGEKQGWFDCDAGKLLNLNLSAGVEVDGHLVYVLVPA